MLEVGDTLKTGKNYLIGTARFTLETGVYTALSAGALVMGVVFPGQFERLEAKLRQKPEEMAPVVPIRRELEAGRR